LPGGSVKVNVYTDLPQPAFKKQLKVISLSDEY
jgi:beta-mannosidase